MMNETFVDTINDAVDITVLTSFEGVQIEGEPDLIVELIDLYLEDAPLRMASLQEAVAEADGGGIKRAAHALKGSSANLGARRVAELCEQLERAEDDNSLQEVRALLLSLEREFEFVRQTFSAERLRRL